MGGDGSLPSPPPFPSLPLAPAPGGRGSEAMDGGRAARLPPPALAAPRFAPGEAFRPLEPARGVAPSRELRHLPSRPARRLEGKPPRQEHGARGEGPAPRAAGPPGVPARRGRGGSPASEPPRERLPHNGAPRTPAFLRAEFCRDCHQFPPDGFALNGKLLENTYAEWKASPFARAGVQCQDCHMPDRRHLWRGIHDAATVRALDARPPLATATRCLGPARRRSSRCLPAVSRVPWGNVMRLALLTPF